MLITLRLMKPAPTKRYWLAGGVALLLAAPLYWQYTGLLLRLLPWALAAGLGAWILVRQRLGPGPHPAGARRRELGRMVAGVARGLRRARWWLLGTGAGLLWLAMRLGYRLPWFDAHPDWPEFPQLADSSLVAEQVSAAELLHRYHYHLPVIDGDSAPGYFESVYRTNLRNVRQLGSRITGNEFKWPWWGNFGIHLDFNGQSFHEDTIPSGPRIDNTGYEYFQVVLGREAGYFKGPLYPDGGTGLAGFYQFNYPTTTQDTLFLYNGGTYWLVRRP